MDPDGEIHEKIRDALKEKGVHGFSFSPGEHGFFGKDGPKGMTFEFDGKVQERIRKALEEHGVKNFAFPHEGHFFYHDGDEDEGEDEDDDIEDRIRALEKELKELKKAQVASLFLEQIHFSRVRP